MNLDLPFWVAFSQIPKIGAQRFQKLYNYFPDLKTAWQANQQELKNSRLDESTVSEILIQRSAIDPDKEWSKLEKENIKIIIIKDANYPKLLKETFSPPALLYYKGAEPKSEELGIAVVGTRKITSYGQRVVENIVGDLVQQGLVIISGLALGVDALAHEITLKHSGKTIAILGSGLDQQNIYPSPNRYLSQKIIESGGTVISEFPIGTMPLKHHFPQRNRIIAGWSLGTLVVEAGETSGALITAQLALENNREVFAVPGSIYNPSSVGPNKLLQDGAHFVTSAQDILEVLNLQEVKSMITNRQILPETDEEKKIIEVLTSEAIHIDELGRLAQLPTHILNATLPLMEMKGLVKNVGNMSYIRYR